MYFLFFTKTFYNVFYHVLKFHKILMEIKNEFNKTKKNEQFSRKMSIFALNSNNSINQLLNKI